MNEVHRFHHQRDPKLGDVSFGLSTTLVDHALGTFHVEGCGPFSSEELGIGTEPDYPIGCLAESVALFRRGQPVPCAR